MNIIKWNEFLCTLLKCHGFRFSKKRMKEFSLKDISTYRATFMGIAMIWVVLYHLKFEFKPLQLLVRYGYTGVDIFMFVSGFGLFFSLLGNPSIPRYMKRRFLRILPAYLIVGALLSWLWYHDDITTYFIRCTMIGYWLSEEIYFEWFMPSLCTLYLCFPVAYFKFLKPFKAVWFFGIVILFEFLSILYIVYPYTDNWHYLFIYRVPVFLYGVLTALFIDNKNFELLFKKIAIASAIIGLGLFGVGYVTHITPLNYYATSWFTPSLIILMCILAKNYTIIRFWGSKIGLLTLEIYLWHLLVLRLASSFSFRYEHHDLSTVILLFLSIILGWMLHSFLNIIIRIK